MFFKKLFRNDKIIKAIEDEDLNLVKELLAKKINVNFKDI